MKKKFIKTVKELINDNFLSKLFFYFACLLFVFLGLTFFYFGDLSYWDAVGHLDSGRFINENTLPDFTGFNAKYLLGFEQNLFYNPLLHYFEALLMLLFSPTLTGKLVLSLLLIIFPFTIYFFSKKITPNFNEARYLSILIMAFWVLIDNLADFSAGTPGIGPNSTLQVGLIPAFLIAPLTFIFLGILIDVVNKKRSWVIASIFLSLILLTHFSGFGVALFLIFYILIEKQKRILLMKILFTSLILTAFWWIPFVTYYSFVPQAVFIGNIPQILIILTLISFIISITQKDSFIKAISIFCFALLLLWMYTTYFQAPFQFFRLQPLIVLFVIIPIYKFILTKRFDYLKKSIVIIFFAILVLGFFSQIKISTTNTIEIYSENDFDGRLLFLKQEDYLSEFHTTYIDTTNQIDGLSANGLFVESTKTSELICALMVHLDPDFRCWGVVTNKKERYSFGVLEKQLNVLGINWIVASSAPTNLLSIESKEVLLKRTTTVYDDSFFFVPTHSYKVEKIKYVYQVNDTNLIEIPNFVYTKNIGGEREWTNFVMDWFFTKDKAVYIKNNLKSNPNDFNYSFEKKKNYDLNYSFNQNYSQININVDGDEEIPILIKFNFDPRWVAYDQDGKIIPIYIASPYSMLVIGRGEITLKNQPNLNLVDIIARIISLIGIIFVLLKLFLFGEKNYEKN